MPGTNDKHCDLTPTAYELFRVLYERESCFETIFSDLFAPGTWFALEEPDYTANIYIVRWFVITNYGDYS